MGAPVGNEFQTALHAFFAGASAQLSYA